MSRLIIYFVIGLSLYGWFFFFSPGGDSFADKPVITNLENKKTFTTEGVLQDDLDKLIKTFRVVKVIDGDTIVIDKEGREETVRLIGVDTPETVHPSKAVQCFGVEASVQTKEWLSDKEVMLEFDPSQAERDKYGRLLAYVIRSDGLFVNRELIEDGFAYEYTYNLPYKYQVEFKAAEELARESGAGLWSSAACTEEDRSFHTNNQSIDLVYPEGHMDKDCSDFLSQSEAQTYFEQGGGSPTSNYDRLDSDHDGVACESLSE